MTTGRDCNLSRESSRGLSAETKSTSVYLQHLERWTNIFPSTFGKLP
ncbi:MAG: hypothetical protein JWP89_2216 [Schlesneria sp.]|nr:hypothetical protein [Schlesneria sp.]